MGCMGLSLEDFSACTPSEFSRIYEQWREREDAALRNTWEQTRLLMLGMLQPWSKKRLTAREVLPLPWDEAAKDGGGTDTKKAAKDGGDTTAKSGNPMNTCSGGTAACEEEDIGERYRAAMRRYGMKGA